MKPFQFLYVLAIIALGTRVTTVPVDSAGNVSTEKYETEGSADLAEDGKQPATPRPASVTDLETSNSNPETTYVLPQQHSPGGTSHFDPSIYAGYLTPEAFQQYLAQFAGTFAPYAYPGYGPAPVYPGPYAVQTGYDGFLVPTVSGSLSTSGTASSTSVASSILTAIQNLLPTLMSSTVVQIVVTVLGALAMILFGGAITTAICNVTPLCDISFKAISYLRGNGASDVGRMLAEGITPERVRRASEFVRNAIRKYKEMQKIMLSEEELEAQELQ